MKTLAIKTAVRKLLTTKQLELILRYYTGLSIAVYGLAKLINGQFAFEGPLYEKAINELNGFQLTWLFFGHSRPYAIIIGLTQLVGVGLLLIPRTKLIGALFLIPVMVNIVLIDVFYGIPYGATMNAIFYLAGLIVILLLNKETVLNAIKILFDKQKIERNWQAFAKNGLLILGGSAVIIMLKFAVALLVERFI